MDPEKRLILEIGCGNKKVFSESIGLDVRPVEGVDVVADAHELPFDDEYFDHVYSSHVIEHFSHQDVKDVLEEWVRVLKKGGIFEIRCPDLRARAFIFAFMPSKGNIKNIYGAQDYPENFHQCGFSSNLLKELLSEVGIGKIKRINDGFRGIPFLPSDLHLKGIKL